MLVVIAILAILATVSVVGYTSYISKANNSVAMQEAQPYESMIRNETTINGATVIGTADGKNITATYSNGTVTLACEGTGDVTLSTKVFGSDNPEGKFTFADGKITYTTKNGKGTYVLFSNN